MDRVERYKALRARVTSRNIDCWIMRTAQVERQTVRVWNMMQPDRAPSARILTMLENAIDRNFR